MISPEEEEFMSVTTAKNQAKKILKENFVLEPPVDVYEIARNAGIKIVEDIFPDDFENVSGFINIEDDLPVMYVNADEPENRRKFTVAHELGHWVLHEDAIREDSRRAVLFRVALGQANKDPLEKEANAFAAELLVPTEFFERVKGDKSQNELADVFKVSAEVIGYRMVDLGHATQVKK
jgi:Zn-dependent peptidase ImmA (M78 family)